MKLAITSLGMVSPLGRDVVTTCAAVRAGLTFAADLDDGSFVDPEEDDLVALRGSPIRGYTDGFQGVGRWMRMAEGCFDDLIRYGHLPDGLDAPFWRTTGLILLTPPLDEERLQWPTPVDPDVLKAVYGVRLLNLMGLPIPPGLLDIVCFGHGGAAVAVERARQLIEGGRLQRAIVLGADSYVDSASLEWLGENGRLKSPDNPVGLAPGEAGACFLLEAEAVARHRGAVTEGFVVGAASGFEEANHAAGRPSQGVALAVATAEALGAQRRFGGHLFVDANGESWRASELASARTRLAGRLAESVRPFFPAASLGDTGAASGPVAVCVAVRSSVRASNPVADALVLSSSEHGHVGAIRILATAETDAGTAARSESTKRSP